MFSIEIDNNDIVVRFLPLCLNRINFYGKHYCECLNYLNLFRIRDKHNVLFRFIPTQ